MTCKILAALLVSIAPSWGAAACYGTGSYQSCYDDSGNSYSVNRLGNSTYVDGYNSQTGSSWSQESYTTGSTTTHYGTSSDGGSWNITQQQMGGGSQFYSGTNSNGESFAYTCDRYGSCY